ncbi:MAG: hypothetical protein UY48_C0013G0013 [Candidatus Gottesmanbacteria bacterium GW2011_GWB1_49_7]|uniref:Uncharacterized protein n=1 Tax=Candidatus Gottesmanbacteria bacterium GW2011_GWB1_49_7 TaxID=1618448 RepID=A0A0G1YA04_9BACT|nr:MAG: hypothetical protein UY48_C0013G0013 [Candidatus Gottesmanbacteria bacterium GW2011_GWB1_49_7]
MADKIRKEYRVWRKKSGDQRETQGHYILADTKKEAIRSVLRKGESPKDLDAIVWKKGTYFEMRRTPGAKCFLETGKKCRGK